MKKPKECDSLVLDLPPEPKIRRRPKTAHNSSAPFGLFEWLRDLSLGLSDGCFVINGWEYGVVIGKSPDKRACLVRGEEHLAPVWISLGSTKGPHQLLYRRSRYELWCNGIPVGKAFPLAGEAQTLRVNLYGRRAIRVFVDTIACPVSFDEDSVLKEWFPWHGN